MDAVLLSRLQFALTVSYHFLFVPLSVGLGLIVALTQTHAYKTGNAKDEATAHFWVKVFTTTFVVGVATGITMEFSFGTNWADYSRFVGDIFGAPLAAEALLAFFLESSFLGVLLFGRKKVSKKFYTVSAWLVWAGSMLSALWILIANSWMQTPAGFEVEQTATGAKAVLTNFAQAALNPSTIPHYLHTVDALLILGAFVTIAVGAYHLLHGDKQFGRSTLRTGTVVAIVTIILMVPFAHIQAVEVGSENPEKLAAMEAQYEDGPVGMSIVGSVDEQNQQLNALEVPIPGITSWLATGDSSTSFQGLNSFGEDDTPPVTMTYQSYHLMVLAFGGIVLWLIFALVQLSRLKKGREPQRGILKALMWAPLLPYVAIFSGWVVAEVGRQPWIVYHQLRTADAISQSVGVPELLITIVLFIVIYALIAVIFLKILIPMLKKGPVVEEATAGDVKAVTGKAAKAHTDAKTTGVKASVARKATSSGEEE